jgi:HlyD family secretion protein
VRRQAEAAKRQAEASKAQIGALRAQRQNVRLQRDRAATLYGEQIIPTSTVEGLEATTQELAYRASAASAAAGAAESAAAAAEGQVQAATEQAQAAAEQVRALESQLAVAQAALERARVALRECRIVAPRSGVVTLRAREPGEVVLPGSTLFEITDSAELTVTFYVANAHLGRVAVGAKVDAIADAYPGQRFPGVVRRVSPEAEFTPRNIQTRSDRDRLVYAVEAVLENPGGRLRVGMPVEVVVVEAKR